MGKEGNAYGGVTSGRNGHGSVNTGFEDETAQAGTPMVTFNSNNAQTPGITLNDSRSQVRDKAVYMLYTIARTTLLWAG